MKLLSNLLFSAVFLCNSLHGQGPLSDAVYTQTIIATEYKNSDTVKCTTSIVYLDRNFKVLDGSYGQTNDEGAEKVVVLKDDVGAHLEVIINSRGDTAYFIGANIDTVNRTIYSFQITDKDTVVRQRRVLNLSGKDSLLYNYEDGSYYLSFSWEYDSQDRLIRSFNYNVYTGDKTYEKTVYDDSSRTVTYYESVNGKPYVIVSKRTQLDSLTSRTELWYNQEGFVYGIKLVTKKGGYSITTKDQYGENKRYELFDNKGRLVASISRETKKL